MDYKSLLTIPLCLMLNTCQPNFQEVDSEGEIKFLPAVPLSILNTAPSLFALDYGKVRFGKIEIKPDTNNVGNTIILRVRESAEPDPLPSTGQEPIGVRYLQKAITLTNKPMVVELQKADERIMPKWAGRVMPFRYIDVYGWHGKLPADAVNVSYSIAKDFNEEGYIHFEGGPQADNLNKLLELSNHTIQATSFAGIFVDGDRERLPYEADAYINMLGWYALTTGSQTPHHTFEYLVRHPSWPTEWQAHLIFMAWADYMQTGDKAFLAKHYEWLKTVSLKDAINDQTGLVDITKISKSLKSKLKVTYPMGDIVDWPQNQRDNHEMRPFNTVTNSFVYSGFITMQKIAEALGKTGDQEYFAGQAQKLHDNIRQKVRLDNGLYSDGIGSSHTSAHSLFMTLNFGLVDAKDEPLFTSELSKKIDLYGGGFPCSVFTAQYLLEALFKSHQDAKALELILNKTDRGWLHMIDQYDATVTHEAWDVKYKDNEDWTHAWGAALANIIPRYLLGIQPTEAGWKRWRLSPSKALTSSVHAKIPTPEGLISVFYNFEKRTIVVDIPANTVAEYGENGNFLILESGTHELNWRTK